MYCYNEADYKERIKWFQEARFGLFLHFGLYAIPGRGEWVRSLEEITVEDYQPYFDSFDPKDFDAREWARMAREAGMKYAVLTAKHHDGFCLFDSAYTDYKVTNTPFGRDIIKEYVEAFREAGLKVGLYYSLLDWHHPDYPHYGDRNHPMRRDPTQTYEERDFARYLTYYHNQVRELCSNYGKLDLLWFDFSYDDLRGEAWRAAELIDMVRTLQPGILIDNRLEVSGEGFGSLYECNPTPWHGDFVTPEKMIPPKGLQDVKGRDLCWESCITMNNNWGYHREDHFFKPADFLIRKLVECVSKGGNMILNVGPTETGAFPKESVDILAKIGEWMAVNGESIYGCGKSGLDKPEFGRLTGKGDTLYLHVFENSIGPLPLPQVEKSKVKGAVMLCNGKAVPVSTSWVHSDYPDVCFLDLGEDPVLPDATDTVIRLELQTDEESKQLWLRKAQPADEEEVLELYHSVIGSSFCTWNEFYPGEPEIQEDTKTENLFLLMDRNKLAGAISIVPENEMDDFTEWSSREETAEFARVVIAPGYQGRGLAGLLVEHVLEEMKRRGCRTVHISVAKINLPALKTYMKQGFRIAGEKEMYGNSYYLAEKEL